ncbi:MAG: hypothetical protein ACK45I_10140 [Bacteroidota bacterium]|jgi:hypothetical protein
MTKHKIQTMADLVRERKRVVHQLHETEKELAVSASYFKHNHKKIIWHYVNPFSGDTTLGVITQTLETAVIPMISEATGVNIRALKGDKAVSETVKSALVTLAVTAVKKWIRERKNKKETNTGTDSETMTESDNG